MAAERRAMRIQELAERVVKEFDGDLGAALRAMSHKRAHAASVAFPSIANLGADRIHLLVRILRGQDDGNYAAGYKMAQQAIQTATPATFDARIQAYLLLRRHGQLICK